MAVAPAVKWPRCGGVVSARIAGANMVASGLTGTTVANSEGLIQSYKTGHMIGSKPRYLTYVQLLAVPVAAIVIAYVYPIFRVSEGIGQADGLVPPISAKWYGFAKILSEGSSALHPSALWALVVGVALGVVLSVMEQNERLKTWVPSPTGIGIGMLVPAGYVATMFLGALISWAARRRAQGNPDAWVLPLASSFIAGEALIAVILEMLIAGGGPGAGLTLNPTAQTASDSRSLRSCLFPVTSAIPWHREVVGRRPALPADDVCGTLSQAGHRGQPVPTRYAGGT